jgi:hypothetical protein
MQRLGTLLACGLLAITLGVGCAHPAKSYFGHIEATPTCKPGENGCADIFQMLRGLDDCKTVGECKAGEDILKAVFGTTYRPSVPDYIVYFEQGAKGFHFVKHNPVLMWGHENTPHVYGARDVYAVVFTERRACLSAHVTTIYRNDPNPFSGVLSVLGSKADPAAAKAPERTVGQFRWYPEGSPHFSI